jgi:hypothetical protein
MILVLPTQQFLISFTDIFTTTLIKLNNFRAIFQPKDFGWKKIKNNKTFHKVFLLDFQSTSSTVFQYQSHSC